MLVNPDFAISILDRTVCNSIQMLIDMKIMVSKVASSHGTMAADTAIYMAMKIWNLTKF